MTTDTIYGCLAPARSGLQLGHRARRRLMLLAVVAGPGVLTMLGENDGPSMLSYVTTGALCGIGVFVPFILVTFAMAYVVQEATIRIGLATHRGHADLIFSRFGHGWGYFAMVELAIGNVLTLVTEFIAIRSGAAFLGVPAPIAVFGSVGIIAAAFATRRYFTWERFALLLAAGNIVFIPVALAAHPDPHAFARAFSFGQQLPAGNGAMFLTLILANVGATVTPWMIFFQQSAVTDKGLTQCDLSRARLDTGIGAAVAASVAIAAVATGAVLFAHHANVSALNGGADFATALRPYIGAAMAHLFALGMIEAGLIAAVTISASSAYAAGEVLRGGSSLNLPFSKARAFYAAGLLSIAIAAAVVLVPHAPLLTITLLVNVLATLLMAPALLFVLLLANDRELLGRLANGALANTLGGAVMAVIVLLSAAYGVIVVFPHL
ncbi:MAG: NRAMP family divalent metal transporter [Candidatus Baltobacteraceae bacterium]